VLHLQVDAARRTEGGPVASFRVSETLAIVTVVLFDGVALSQGW